MRRLTIVVDVDAEDNVTAEDIARSIIINNESVVISSVSEVGTTKHRLQEAIYTEMSKRKSSDERRLIGQRLVAFFYEKHRAVFGSPPVIFSWPKEMAIMAAVLSDSTEVEIETMINFFFDEPTDFQKKNDMFSLSDFHRNVNSIRVRLSKTKRLPGKAHTIDVRKEDGWLYRQEINAKGEIVSERKREEIPRAVSSDGRAADL